MKVSVSKITILTAIAFQLGACATHQTAQNGPTGRDILAQVDEQLFVERELAGIDPGPMAKIVAKFVTNLGDKEAGEFVAKFNNLESASGLTRRLNLADLKQGNVSEEDAKAFEEKAKDMHEDGGVLHREAFTQLKKETENYFNHTKMSVVAQDGATQLKGLEKVKVTDPEAYAIIKAIRFGAWTKMGKEWVTNFSQKYFHAHRRGLDVVDSPDACIATLDEEALANEDKAATRDVAAVDHAEKSLDSSASLEQIKERSLLCGEGAEMDFVEKDLGHTEFADPANFKDEVKFMEKLQTQCHRGYKKVIDALKAAPAKPVIPAYCTI